MMKKNNLVDKLVYQERVGEDILVRKNPLSGEVIFLPLKERSLADFF
ncbi:MAG: hypothetical protein KatS3mg098_006 [Candidatus Parcubacteria bacterium]|nr:MAG: hypothetical protein KatS3mg098_006 [Candidatus Parcubacteria bacterium]